MLIKNSQTCITKFSAKSKCPLLQRLSSKPFITEFRIHSYVHNNDYVICIRYSFKNQGMPLMRFLNHNGITVRVYKLEIWTFCLVFHCIIYGCTTSYCNYNWWCIRSCENILYPNCIDYSLAEVLTGSLQ